MGITVTTPRLDEALGLVAQAAMQPAFAPAEIERLRADVAQKRAQKDYRGALAGIASLRPAVDLFFDKVLVNAPDAAVRRNRLTLLATVLTEFSAIADFSEIVTGS